MYTFAMTFLFVSQYESERDEESVQMLQRSTQVGEHYFMGKPTYWDASEKLPKGYLDIFIFDEDQDTLVRIKFEDAIDAMCIPEVFDKKKGSMFGLHVSRCQHVTY
tara:strand:+ start:141 stop:458 length:318 start_codon:yes stop_codon:yes gene_type:complete